MFYCENENLLVIRNNITTRFIFDAEGSGHADVEWVAFSDSRLKTDVEDVPYGLVEVLQLRPKRYDKQSGSFDGSGTVVLEGNKRKMIDLCQSFDQRLYLERETEGMFLT